jgi:hypothetical protein
LDTKSRDQEAEAVRRVDAGSDRRLIKMPQTQLKVCISLSRKGKIKDAGAVSEPRALSAVAAFHLDDSSTRGCRL